MYLGALFTLHILSSCIIDGFHHSISASIGAGDSLQAGKIFLRGSFSAPNDPSFAFFFNRDTVLSHDSPLNDSSDMAATNKAIKNPAAKYAGLQPDMQLFAVSKASKGQLPRIVVETLGFNADASKLKEVQKANSMLQLNEAKDDLENETVIFRDSLSEDSDDDSQNNFWSPTSGKIEVESGNKDSQISETSFGTKLRPQVEAEGRDLQGISDHLTGVDAGNQMQITKELSPPLGHSSETELPTLASPIHTAPDDAATSDNAGNDGAADCELPSAIPEFSSHNVDEVSTEPTSQSDGAMAQNLSSQPIIFDTAFMEPESNKEFISAGNANWKDTNNSKASALSSEAQTDVELNKRDGSLSDDTSSKSDLPESGSSNQVQTFEADRQLFTALAISLTDSTTPLPQLGESTVTKILHQADNNDLNEAANRVPCNEVIQKHQERTAHRNNTGVLWLEAFKSLYSSILNKGDRSADKKTEYAIKTIANALTHSSALDFGLLQQLVTCDTDGRGRTPLMRLVQNGFIRSIGLPSTWTILRDKKYQDIHLLIDKEGNNLLHLAVLSRSPAVVRGVLWVLESNLTLSQLRHFFENRNIHNQNSRELAQTEGMPFSIIGDLQQTYSELLYCAK